MNVTFTQWHQRVAPATRNMNWLGLGAQYLHITCISSNVAQMSTLCVPFSSPKNTKRTLLHLTDIHANYTLEAVSYKTADVWIVSVCVTTQYWFNCRSIFLRTIILDLVTWPKTQCTVSSNYSHFLLPSSVRRKMRKNPALVLKAKSTQ